MGVITKGNPKRRVKGKSGTIGRGKVKVVMVGVALIFAVAFVSQIKSQSSFSVRRASESLGVSPDVACEQRLDSFDAKFNHRRAMRKEHYVEYRDENDQESRDNDDEDEEVYDLFEPEAVCFDEERFGSRERHSAFGDGAQFVCAVDLIAEKSKEDRCLVYSVGSNNNVDFEVAVSNFMGCETHTFDPTLKSTFVGDKYATFHPWGIGIDGTQSASTSKEFEWTSKGIETIMKELGHLNRTLDILKIDCGRCYFKAMPVLFEAISAGRIKVNQIQIELHGVNFGRVEHFFEAADKAKMRVFHKERNNWGCAGYMCVEYALISEDFLREANRASFCNTASQ
jgi:hypothetical protein